MTDPTTPAGLPRNRAADAWRERAERAESRSCDLMAGMAVLVVAALALSSVCDGIASERDAARAQVSAAEMAEARNAENTCGHQYDVGRIRKQVCVGVATGFQWWSVSESAPPRIIYDDIGTWRK